MCDLFLYQHFCSSGHSEDDITIMPIEEVSLEDGECMSLASKRLQREEYWYRELATIYPCGHNDDVKNLGNVSKKGIENIVINNNITSEDDLKNVIGNMIQHGQIYSIDYYT